MAREILVVTVMFLLLAGCTSVAFADIYNKYTYETPQITMSTVGNPWTLKITTNNPNVAQVTVNWYNDYFGTGDLVETHVVKGTFNTATHSFTVQDTLIPHKSGWWFVTFNFQDKNGVNIYSTSHLEYLDKFSGHFYIQNVVPEVPLLGTIGTVAAMLVGFGFYIKRRKQY